MRILLVEDDALLAEGIADGLRLSGHEVDTASSGQGALTALHGQRHEVMILDLGLPDQDGIDLLRRIRRLHEELLVLILTARDSLKDRVRGLDIGADDYLVKPVALKELEARVRAVARRRLGHRDAQLSSGALSLDVARHAAVLAGLPLALTPREWDLLELFVRHAGELIRKEKIISCFNSWDNEVTPNAVEVYISRLRSKLEPHARIRTVRGYGYLLENSSETAA
jgi:two-component system OmpR family response regulator